VGAIRSFAFLRLPPTSKVKGAAHRASQPLDEGGIAIITSLAMILSLRRFRAAFGAIPSN
jgi:hypothetical protein